MSWASMRHLLGKQDARLLEPCMPDSQVWCSWQTRLALAESQLTLTLGLSVAVAVSQQSLLHDCCYGCESSDFVIRDAGPGAKA